MSKKSTVMTEGAIWKEILFFSIPLILGNLFQQLYNTVDSIIAGNWMPEAYYRMKKRHTVKPEIEIE